MEQIEYKAISRTLSINELQTYLNQMGLERWKLIHVEVGERAFGTNFYTLIFEVDPVFLDIL